MHMDFYQNQISAGLAKTYGITIVAAFALAIALVGSAF